MASILFAMAASEPDPEPSVRAEDALALPISAAHEGAGVRDATARSAKNLRAALNKRWLAGSWPPIAVVGADEL